MGPKSFPGVKRPGLGADHPPPSKRQVMKGQSYTSTQPLGLRGLLWGEPLPLLFNLTVIFYCIEFHEVRT